MKKPLDLISREKEISFLRDIYENGRPEFVAIYGRRRIGKTFLIKSLFGDEFTFYATGVLDGNSQTQFASFTESLERYGHQGEMPKNWMEAFSALGKLISASKRKKRCVVFLDELPCFDTPRTQFLAGLDYFWNAMASSQKNILLIVCGSATSWMIDKLIMNNRGLYNRITHQLHLEPFSLRDVEEYARSYGADWSRLNLLEMYSILGGVPFYWSLLDFRKSPAKNIDELFFGDSPTLGQEYNRLFASLFKKPEKYEAIIDALSDSRSGLTRQELTKALGTSGGSELTKALDNLENSGFIRTYRNGQKTTRCYFQITDPFILFHNKFCKARSTAPAFWQKHQDTPLINTWNGLAFEHVAALHTDEIIYALHLDTIPTERYSWRSNSASSKAQIDLVIERSDRMYTICEMKYTGDKAYNHSKEEHEKLQNRISIFREEYAKGRGIQPILVTTHGISNGKYSTDFTAVVTLDDIFEAKPRY